MKKCFIYIFTWLLFLFASNAQAQTKYSLQTSVSNIQGSASLHDWQSDITQLTFKGNFQLKNNILIALKNVEMKILIAGIKSKEGKIMDTKT